MKSILLHRRVLSIVCLCLIGLHALAFTEMDSFKRPPLSSLLKDQLLSKVPSLSYGGEDKATESNEPVTPPIGLVTEEYTLISILYTAGDSGYDYLQRDDNQQSLRIGFSGKEVYFQGLSLTFPEAWVKGFVNDDQTAVTIPIPQYIGSIVNEEGETENRYFMAADPYHQQEEGTFAIQFSNENGFFALPAYYPAFYEADYNGISSVLLLFPQIVKGVPYDELVTPPDGIIWKDYLLEGENAMGYGDLIHQLVKVGFQNNDVYISGLFPGLTDACIKGSLSGNEITFSKWQFLGVSDAISSLLGGQLKLEEEIGSKKLYLYGIDLGSFSINDVVFKFDQTTGVMTGNAMIVGASRVCIELALWGTNNVVITPIADQAATPSVPEISSFMFMDNDYCLSFMLPVIDEEGSGMLPDKLCYKILIGNGSQTSTIAFKPADYETLQTTKALIPYEFTDGKYFTSIFNYYTAKLEKKVLLKDNLFTSLNKIGVQSVYYGGGTTNESEVAWFTIDEAIEQLREEINTAQYYLDDSRPFGMDTFRTEIDKANNFIYNIYSLDNDERDSYNILQILQEIRALKAAEDAYLALNANADANNMLALLKAEIDNAYELYYDYDMPNGKDELFEAIDRARTIYDEIAALDEETLKDYDLMVIWDEIESLREAEQYYSDINIKEDDFVLELEEEISNAYEIYYDYYYNYNGYGMEAFLEIISHAQDLVNDYYNLDEEERLEFDMTVVMDEIAMLQDVEQQFVEFNERINGYLDRLDTEISKAYDLCYDDDLTYDRDVLRNAINHAELMLSEFYGLEEEDVFGFDMSRFSDEIYSLKEAEQAFVVVNTIINENEWQILKDYYQSANSSTWERVWDFSSATRSRKALPGVKSYNGHVLNIYLRGNNINGKFPYEFLKLPNLEELDLSCNQLTGDIGDEMAQFLEDGNKTSSSLKFLDISQNKLSGNIGTIANALTGLTYLDASENQLEEVSPVIPKTVQNLYLDNQDIQREVELHIQDVEEGILLQSIPNILLYNHSKQSYQTDLTLQFSDNQGGKISMSFSNESFEIDNYRYVYTGESGDLLNASTWGHYLTATLPIRLYFDEGDADFNGQVNILDLQTQIDYIVEDYYGVFNLTAANLWKDETINVQDAVCMVNHLLDKTSSAGSTMHRIKQKEQVQAEEENQVFIYSDRLYINATQPVAAFDIIISSEADINISSELSRYGLACSIKKSDGFSHLIGYSLSGNTLPEGLIEIGDGLAGEVVYAMCASKDACVIPVVLNRLPTDIVKPTSDKNPSDIKYIMPFGTKYSIYIDANRKKTIHRTSK